MTGSAHQLAFDFGGNGAHATLPGASRREARQPVVRLVEYRPFPRVASDARWRTGLTRDLSDSGLCLRSELPQPVGSLLHVVVRRVDGRPAFESVARVVWCERVSGRFLVGLGLVARRSREPARVRSVSFAARSLSSDLARA